MRLDATDVRYITPDEFRVLTAVEMGSKNHEVVPSTLVAQISALRHSGISKLLASLAKRKLVARVQNKAYDGVRLTYGGYDYLAVRALSKRKSIYSVGHRIGVGKESDIQIVSDEEGETRVLKLHRLGRISFRKIKEKRDYMGSRKSASWMYMSRLAAEKEYAFMQVLSAHGFPVPQPIDQARHTLVMSYIDAYPLRQVSSMPEDQIRRLYTALMDLIVRLARCGLIHGDFNEFNLLVREVYEESEYEEDAPAYQAPEEAPADAADDLPEATPGVTIQQGKGYERVLFSEHGEEDDESGDEEEEEEEGEEEEDAHITLDDGVQVEPILIDFPQMVSIEHPNAEYYFQRDVEGVRRFFQKRFRFVSDAYPHFAEVLASRGDEPRLDAATKASGYGQGVDLLGSVCVLLIQHFARLRTREDGAGSENEQEEEEEEEEDDAGDAHDSDPDQQLHDNAYQDEQADEDAVHASEGPVPAAHSVRAPLDTSQVAARVAASQAHAARRTHKHHGRRSQATKTGRRHGGGKAKHNKQRTVTDSLQF